MKTIENAASRYIKASKKGKFLYSDELEILEHLVKKFNLISQADFAKKEGITQAGASKRVKSGKEMSINLGGRDLIIN